MTFSDPSMMSLWSLELLLLPAQWILLSAYVLFCLIEPPLSRVLSQQVSPAVTRLCIRLIKLIILIIAAVSALGTIGVDVTDLILSAFALGFVFKDMILNFLSGVMILVYRPVKENDVISVLNFSGRIIRIDLRYTHLEKGDDVVLIPNLLLLNSPVSVHTPCNDKKSVLRSSRKPKRHRG